MSEDLDEFQHPKFAEMYLKQSPKAERRGETAHRVRLLSGLSGRVIEVGAGNGLNFPHYPAAVTEVVAVEPDATMRAAAEKAAEGASVPVRVVAGHSGVLPVEDGWADAVVFSLVLCSVPDPAATLAEAARVLGPDGYLRFYEHVRSTGYLRGRFQDLIQPIWTRQAGGCYPNRDTAANITAAGYTITELDAIGFAFMPLTPKVRHIIGTAVRKTES